MDPDEEVEAGVFACAPTAAGGSVVFDYIKFDKCDSYHHTANA